MCSAARRGFKSGAPTRHSRTSTSAVRCSQRSKFDLYRNKPPVGRRKCRYPVVVVRARCRDGEGEDAVLVRAGIGISRHEKARGGMKRDETG